MKQAWRSFNLICGRHRCVSYTTCGYPARWNEKKAQLFLIILYKILDMEIIYNSYFEMYERDEYGGIVYTKYYCTQLIVNN